MSSLLEQYAQVAGNDAVAQLRQLAEPLQGMKVVHVNSTKVGGGVAEILHQLVPLLGELQIDVAWHTIEGQPDFFACTKKFHNCLQGAGERPTEQELRLYERINAENAERLQAALAEADVVFIHDPQPAALIKFFPERKGPWIWRCHIDVSHPVRVVWRYISQFLKDYDASIFSLADFARVLPHPQYLIAPAIDPFSGKNCELSQEFIDGVAHDFNLDPSRPILVQVSRFDRFKDPLGVVKAFHLIKNFFPSAQLVLAGGGATDDPEGGIVLSEVRAAAANDPSIHILELPSDAHRIINALQRMAWIVLQKSIREGFGLTVTEALWKGKPVIGGNTGGIRLQVINHHTGFLVSSPEGAAMRIRYLLERPDNGVRMGEKGRRYVRENFLMTRLARDHLTLMVSLLQREVERIDTTQWRS